MLVPSVFHYAKVIFAAAKTKIRVALMQVANFYGSVVSAILKPGVIRLITPPVYVHLELMVKCTGQCP